MSCANSPCKNASCGMLGVGSGSFCVWFIVNLVGFSEFGDRDAVVFRACEQLLSINSVKMRYSVSIGAF